MYSGKSLETLCESLRILAYCRVSARVSPRTGRVLSRILRIFVYSPYIRIFSVYSYILRIFSVYSRIPAAYSCILARVFSYTGRVFVYIRVYLCKSVYGICLLTHLRVTVVIAQ